MRLKQRGPDYVTDAVTGCWLWVKSVTPTGYPRLWDGTRNRPGHRYYFEEKHGEVPKDRDVHHACGQRLCVNPDHLKVVSRSEHSTLHNAENRTRYVGLNWIAGKRKWRARQMVNGKEVSLGYFHNIEVGADALARFRAQLSSTTLAIDHPQDRA